MQERIQNLIRDIMPDKTLEITGDMLLIEEMGFDSINILELITSLEREFGIVFDDEDLDIGNFVSIGSLSSLMERYNGQSK